MSETSPRRLWEGNDNLTWAITQCVISLMALLSVTVYSAQALQKYASLKSERTQWTRYWWGAHHIISCYIIISKQQIGRRRASYPLAASIWQAAESYGVWLRKLSDNGARLELMQLTELNRCEQANNKDGSKFSHHQNQLYGKIRIKKCWLIHIFT